MSADRVRESLLAQWRSLEGFIRHGASKELILEQTDDGYRVSLASAFALQCLRPSTTRAATVKVPSRTRSHAVTISASSPVIIT
eukprot:1514046-Prymnesium_polylepis.1